MARRKAYKIKRFKNPYQRKSRKKTIKILLSILAILLVFAISFAGLGPLTDFLYNKIIETPSSSQSGDGSESSTPTGETPKPETAVSSVFHLSEAELLAVEGYDALVARIKAGGYTSVILPLKTADTLYFSPTSRLGIRTKSESQSAAVITEKLHAAGLKVIGTFETFMDNKLPRIVYTTENISMAVRYAPNISYCVNTGTSENPTFWISPASDKAQEYIVSLALDAKYTGVDEIIFKSFYFVESRFAYFSDNDAALDKQAVLSDVAAKLNAALGETAVSFEVDQKELISLNQNQYGMGLFNAPLVLNSPSLTDELKTALENNSDRNITVNLTSATEEDLAFLKEKKINRVFVG